MPADVVGQRLAALVGPNLVSVALFGRLADGRAMPGLTPNLLIIVKDASVDALRPIAAVIAGWTKQAGVAPLVFSEREWRASADVFPLEIEDMRDAHTLLAGGAPFAGLQTTRADLRRQLEREVRGKLLQLRAEYAAAARSGKALEQILQRSAGTFFILFRATLRLARRTPPEDVAALVAETATVAGFDSGALEWVLGGLAGRRMPRLAGFDPVAARYLEAVERLAAHVDGIEIEGAP